jgi:O-antigen ligase
VVGLSAINDFRSAQLESNRVWGVIGNLFGNPNDLALHLATMVPLAIALSFITRGMIRKLLYAMCALLLVAAIMVTFSRGGFLGLIGGGAVLTWKLGRRNRLGMVIIVLVFVGVFALAPGGYGSRLSTIFDASKDVTGSSSARQALLTKSIAVALRHPVLGIGMGNFHIVSIHEQASHNAYTQVATEMGAAALLFYVLFMVTPLRRLRRIERETFAARRSSHLFYLSVGMQASLIAYMISSFFGSVAYQFYIYYLVGYAVCLRRLYQNETIASKKVAITGSENSIERAVHGPSRSYA